MADNKKCFNKSGKTLNKKQVEQVLEILEEMHPDARCALDHDSTYHLLLAVVLSAQTTDVSVNKISPALFERFKTPWDLAQADQSEVEELIKAIGLYKNKSRNIIALSQALVDNFNGEVPSTMEELTSLPGVGRKTANVLLAEAFGQQRIAVDTHVFRVSNRIGLACETDVKKTEEMLMKQLPHDKWTRAHHLIIFHGRRICTARKPDCTNCGLKDICLSIE